MTNQRTNAENAYSSTLAATAGSVATSLTVTTPPSISHPFYACVEPNSATKREYMQITNVTGSVLTVTRYLAGSAAGSGITHDAGVEITIVPAAQMFDDLHDRIEGHVHDGVESVGIDHTDLGSVSANQHHNQSHAHNGADGSGTVDHGDTTGRTDDDHTQYLLVAGTRAMTGDLDLGGNDILNLGNAPQGQVVVFTASGSFAKASYPGLRAVVAHVQAGGGGSGSCADTGSGQAACGGGGGGGGYSRKYVPVASLATSETVTVGAGGAGGTNPTGDGSIGGSSSFGAHCSATGGGGGVAGSAVSAPNMGSGGPGSGGPGSGGDFNVPGSQGSAGIGFTGRSSGGAGGASMLGGGRGMRQNTTGAPGQAGQTYGGGASGAWNSQSQISGEDGAAGGAGVVVVELIY